MIKKIKSYNSNNGIVLYPHAGGYAEQLYVKDLDVNVYGVVYPDFEIKFNKMCLTIAQSLHNEKIHKWYAIGSSMGGYVAFLVAHYYERYFNQEFKMLNLFGVGCPKELITKLNNNNLYSDVAPIDISILKTLQINKKKVSSPVLLYISDDKFFDNKKTIEFWSNVTTNTIKLIHTKDQHLPSRNSLCNSFQELRF